MSEENKELGLKIGRPCCGSRTMCLSKDGEDRKSKLIPFFEGVEHIMEFPKIQKL